MAYNYYNSVRLPELPAWDDTNYPNAVICGEYPLFTLFVTANKFIYGTLTNGNNGLVSENGTTYIPYHCDLSGEAFYSDRWTIPASFPSAGTFSEGSGVSSSPIWSNYDVLGSDGDVYLEESLPKNDVDYFLVKRSEIELVANQIRAKMEEPNLLVWPDGLASAVEAIETEPPKVTFIDYSALESGTFTETLESGQTVNYTVTLDDSGQVTAIFNGEYTTTVTWG